jgi:ABC-type phosphate transport system substrate-binding protein
MRVIRKVAVVGAAVVALAGIGVGSAFADPYATPKATDIVGVGSDTVTPLYDGGVKVKDPGTFVTDYNTQSPVPSSLLWSWDAVPPAGVTSPTIVTKPGCVAITRPDGSSAGITALNANTKIASGTGKGVDYCIDFARSSRAPEAVVSGTNGPDAFAVLAGDAITWSSPKPGTGQTSPVPANLTVADMTDIYSCTVSGVTYDNWDQFGGKNAPIVAVLPQNGSGTRSTFLAALGHGPNNPLVPGSCVVNGSNASGPIEENTGVSTTGFGNTAQFDPKGVAAVDDIFPYSIGDYIAQGSGEGTYSGRTIGGHTTGDFAHGVMVLRTSNSTAPTATDNTAPYSKATIINPSYTDALRRLLYNVVRNAGTATAPAFPTTPAYEANLSKIFGPTGWECTNAKAKEDIASYGFILEARNCGSLSAGT